MRKVRLSQYIARHDRLTFVEMSYFLDVPHAHLLHFDIITYPFL